LSQSNPSAAVVWCFKVGQPARESDNKGSEKWKCRMILFGEEVLYLWLNHKGVMRPLKLNSFFVVLHMITNDQLTKI